MTTQTFREGDKVTWESGGDGRIASRVTGLTSDGRPLIAMPPGLPIPICASRLTLIRRPLRVGDVIARREWRVLVDARDVMSARVFIESGWKHEDGIDIDAGRPLRANDVIVHPDGRTPYLVPEDELTCHWHDAGWLHQDGTTIGPVPPDVKDSRAAVLNKAVDDAGKLAPYVPRTEAEELALNARAKASKADANGNTFEDCVVGVLGTGARPVEAKPDHRAFKDCTVYPLAIDVLLGHLGRLGAVIVKQGTFTVGTESEPAALSNWAVDLTNAVNGCLEKAVELTRIHFGLPALPIVPKDPMTRSELSDACGALASANRELLAENAQLRREIERLERKAKVTR